MDLMTEQSDGELLFYEDEAEPVNESDNKPEPATNTVIIFTPAPGNKYIFIEKTEAAKKHPINQRCKKLAVHANHLPNLMLNFNRSYHFKQLKESLFSRTSKPLSYLIVETLRSSPQTVSSRLL